jgi:hypothetical protein
VSSVWPWLALAGLGAFHGLNPAMGWLFSVALGLQHRSRAAVIGSLLPIALGHALSIALIVGAIGVLRAFVDFRMLQVASAVILIGFGIFRLLARHRAKIGMQVSSCDLVIWSFLMATAHGAGLMLLPVLLEMPMRMPGDEHGHMLTGGIGNTTMIGIAAVAEHTAAMLVVAGAVAISVYEWIGLGFLRRGWINVDLLWVLALVGAGMVLLAVALW